MSISQFKVKTATNGNTVLAFAGGRTIELVKKEIVLPKQASYTEAEINAMEQGYLGGSDVDSLQQTSTLLGDANYFNAQAVDVLAQLIDPIQLAGIGQGE